MDIPYYHPFLIQSHLIHYVNFSKTTFGFNGVCFLSDDFHFPFAWLYFQSLSSQQTYHGTILISHHIVIPSSPCFQIHRLRRHHIFFSFMTKLCPFKARQTASLSLFRHPRINQSPPVTLHQHQMLSCPMTWTHCRLVHYSLQHQQLSQTPWAQIQHSPSPRC